MNVGQVRQLAESIKSNIEKVIIGKSDVIDIVLTSLIAGGHVLLEDVPGTGKTLLAKTLAKSIDADFKRIQFTPDLLPTDLIGLNYYNQKISDFTFKKGPLFTNILLADEINRATPRTQSSLLESMEEKQITVDGETRALAAPFFVIATQNPIETQGTFPLPEAQLDRFFVQINMGYPSTDEGVKILERFIQNNPIETLDSVCSCNQLIEMQQFSKMIFVHQVVMKYIIEIVESTRVSETVNLGVSPRGSISLLRASQSYAAIKGRGYVTPDDVKMLAVPVLSHRIILKSGMRGKANQTASILNDILSSVKVPTEDWSKE